MMIIVKRLSPTQRIGRNEHVRICINLGPFVICALLVLSLRALVSSVVGSEEVTQKCTFYYTSQEL